MAAGGGGDAVGALLARRALGDTDERPPLVTTCAWERLRIDPVPGPRARSDFKGLGLVGGELCEVLPSSDTTPSGRSVLPRLAETSGARIFLHDFDGGAVGLTGQFQRLASSLDVDELVVVDVGGDIVARGPESELRSPLADSLTLAAALRVGLPTTVVVLGPGVDAELTEETVISILLGRVEASVVGVISAEDIRDLDAVLAWHPTEATALVAAGAAGMRGTVAMRRLRSPVPITNHSPEVWAVNEATIDSFPLARMLQGSTTLHDAEKIMRDFAVNEIDFERSVAQTPRRSRSVGDLRQLVSTMSAIGANLTTTRHLADSVGPEVLSQLAKDFNPPPNSLWPLEWLRDWCQRGQE